MTLSSSKAQIVLRNMPLSHFHNKFLNSESSDLSIEIYFQIKPVTSNVVNTVIRGFEELSKAIGVEKLTQEDLVTCLSHRQLSVSNEDEVIEALSKWLKPNIA